MHSTPCQWEYKCVIALAGFGELNQGFISGGYRAPPGLQLQHGDERPHFVAGELAVAGRVQLVPDGVRQFIGERQPAPYPTWHNPLAALRTAHAHCQVTDVDELHQLTRQYELVPRLEAGRERLVNHANFPAIEVLDLYHRVAGDGANGHAVQLRHALICDGVRAVFGYNHLLIRVIRFEGVPAVHDEGHHPSPFLRR